MSLDAEEHLTSFLFLFTTETLSKVGREENFLNLTRAFRSTLRLPSRWAGKAQERGKDPPPLPHTCTQRHTGGPGKRQVRKERSHCFSHGRHSSLCNKGYKASVRKCWTSVRSGRSQAQGHSALQLLPLRSRRPDVFSVLGSLVLIPLSGSGRNQLFSLHGKHYIPG